MPKPTIGLPDVPDGWLDNPAATPPYAPDYTPQAAPNSSQDSILGGWRPKEWSLKDSGLNMVMSPDEIKTIDFSGTASPEPPLRQNSTSQAANSSSLPQPDGGGFYSGLGPYQPDASLSGARPVSDQGQDFIRRYELDPETHQVDLKIYPDSQKNPTFGYGRLLDASPAGQAAFQRQLNGMTNDQKQALADQYFAEDVGRAQANVFNRLGSESVARLTQPQYDALVADSFNAGGAPALGPNMARDIRNGDLAAAGQEFNAYWAKNKKTGQWEVPEGLVSRSLQESHLFNEGDYTYDPLRDRSRAAIKVIVANPGPPPRR